MSRPVKYHNADTLLENCDIKGYCFIWPNTANSLVPILTANSPMAKQFATTSVARILFTIIKFPPASKRITRWCTTEFCVNPWHHREAKPFMEKRRKQVLPFDDLPEQPVADIGVRELRARRELQSRISAQYVCEGCRFIKRRGALRQMYPAQWDRVWNPGSMSEQLANGDVLMIWIIRQVAV